MYTIAERVIAPMTAKPPPYRRQRRKSGDLAFVEVAGQRVYLGRHGTADSRERYARIVAELASNRGQLSRPTETITVNEIMADYLTFADEYYRKADGTPTDEPASIRQALRPICELYGRLPAAQFGPKALKAVRESMIADDWSRRYTNAQIGRIKRAFQWATSNELIPASVHHGLQAVAGLRRGRSKARETSPVHPVADAYVEAVQPFVARQAWAMVQLQRLTAGRPGEIIQMRAIDIDTSGAIWLYSPTSHKTQHYGHSRTIYLGPRAQEVVKPFLANRPTDAYLFSPRDARDDKASEATIHRREDQQLTPRKTDRRVSEAYTVASYRRSITRACEAAGIPSWAPARLRHNAATDIRKEFGLEGSQIILGHRHAAVTEIYAETNAKRALEIALQVG